jgi:hydrogenase nickel incorporation protein HypB
VITKVDIAAAVEWDRAAAYAALTGVNPTAPVIETSARTGAGVDVLLDLLLGAPVPGSTPLREAP